MRFLTKLHLVLGLLAALPLLAWSASGLLYVLPGAGEGGSAIYAPIDPTRVQITPAQALAAASAHEGRALPITALTLEQKDGRLTYEAIGGLGAGSLLIDAETGAVIPTPPPSAKARFFQQAHFFYFAGRWQIALLGLCAGIAALLVLTGLALAVGKLTARR